MIRVISYVLAGMVFVSCE